MTTTGQHAAAVEALQRLANLGPRSAEHLVAAGITSYAQLARLGAVPAYVRVRRSGARGVSLNMLWALEGAITGEPWQTVARAHRTSLLLALEACERDAAAADTGEPGQR